MGGLGDQTDIAMALAAAGVIAGDGHQAGVFALGAGIGLHADGVESGDGCATSLRGHGSSGGSPGLIEGAKGWRQANSRQVTGIISLVALSFMVQEPSEIIEWSRARSRFWRDFR